MILKERSIYLGRPKRQLVQSVTKLKGCWWPPGPVEAGSSLPTHFCFIISVFLFIPSFLSYGSQAIYWLAKSNNAQKGTSGVGKGDFTGEAEESAILSGINWLEARAHLFIIHCLPLCWASGIWRRIKRSPFSLFSAITCTEPAPDWPCGRWAWWGGSCGTLLIPAEPPVTDRIQ